MRIVFIGTGDIGLPALRFLLDHPVHQLSAVICQPDKPAGRKLTLTPPATKVLALERGIPVHQPERIRRAVDVVRGLGADLIVVMAYGQILPQVVLDLPLYGCLNLHASLLPKYRGASPVQAPILNGDAETGMTVMYMDAGLDTGDILLTESIPLNPDETGGTLHDRLADLAPVALGKALDLIAAGSAPRIPQDHASATHTRKLERSQGVLDWTKPSVELERLIRAFDPWPGTSTTLPSADGPKLLKVFPKTYSVEQAVLTSNQCAQPAPPGTVIEATSVGITVACGEGALVLNDLQLEGRKRLAAGPFLAGNPLAPGTRLG